MIVGLRGLDLDEKKVVLSLEEDDNDVEYKLVLKEISDRNFIIDSAVDESNVNWTLRADFLCFGRYFDFFAFELNSFIALTCSYIMVM